MSVTMGQQAEALSRGGERVAVARADVSRLCARLTEEMQATAPQWQGGGGRAFQNVVVLWADRQRRIVSALDALASSLHSTESDNVSTDLAQSQAAARIAARIG